MGVFTPLMIVGLRETRSLVVLQRQAKRLRKERALQDGGRYTARAEINRMHLLPALKRNIGRPFCEYNMYWHGLNCLTFIKCFCSWSPL